MLKQIFIHSIYQSISFWYDLIYICLIEWWCMISHNYLFIPAVHGYLGKPKMRRSNLDHASQSSAIFTHLISFWEQQHVVLSSPQTIPFASAAKRFAPIKDSFLMLGTERRPWAAASAAICSWESYVSSLRSWDAAAVLLQPSSPRPPPTSRSVASAARRLSRATAGPRGRRRRAFLWWSRSCGTPRSVLSPPAPNPPLRSL